MKALPLVLSAILLAGSFCGCGHPNVPPTSHPYPAGYIVAQGNVIRVYDGSGTLLIKATDTYVVAASRTVEWSTDSTPFRLGFEGNAQSEVIRADGKVGLPAQSTHPLDSTPRTFHIADAGGERVATATLIISQD
ncbi:MAG: hypothetical protein QUU85_02835 [Candidatus Eisenbacteria bacterium]|nr:hypothetical protein [Candidatus Eisenbacteria bacterium]